MKPLVTFNKRRLDSLPAAHRPRPMPGDLRGPLPPRESGPRVLFSPDGRGVPFHGAWAGGSCFLLCGGPSLKTLDLAPLHGRGYCTMALNNAWLVHRPTFWMCADPPGRFSDVGWRDPSILKFVPFVHSRGKLRTMKEGKAFETQETPSQMPGTFFFVRNDGYNPTTFLDEDGISWGTLKKTSDVLGVRNSRSVMLCAMKMLPWLGFTTIYLLGCDFHMPLGHGPAYAWSEDKGKVGRMSNNRLYDILTLRFTALAPLLEERGIRVFNCNPTSALKVFPYLPYEKALEAAKPQASWGVDKGWY